MVGADRRSVLPGELLADHSDPASDRGWPRIWWRPIICVHSAADKALRAGLFLVKHPYGEVGLYGMPSPRVANLQSYGDHNEDFDLRLDLAVGTCDEWMRKTAELAEAAL